MTETLDNQSGLIDPRSELESGLVGANLDVGLMAAQTGASLRASAAERRNPGMNPDPLEEELPGDGTDWSPEPGPLPDTLGGVSGVGAGTGMPGGTIDRGGSELAPDAGDRLGGGDFNPGFVM